MLKCNFPTCKHIQNHFFKIKTKRLCLNKFQIDFIENSLSIYRYNLNYNFYIVWRHRQSGLCRIVAAAVAAAVAAIETMNFECIHDTDRNKLIQCASLDQHSWKIMCRAYSENLSRKCHICVMNVYGRKPHNK